MIFAGKAEVDRVKGEGGGLEKYKNARGCYDNFLGVSSHAVVMGETKSRYPKVVYPKQGDKCLPGSTQARCALNVSLGAWADFIAKFLLGAFH